MALVSGTRLGPYEIVAPLGAGGMGEVYRARDSRLGRDVAVKALPEGFAREPERLARFEREAKLLASLSHENIAGIHGLEEVGDQRYLILEFVDGETLAERLRRGPMPLDEVLEVGRHIAMALETAHEAGIVHRDLKPANIMLTGSGAVKVLDFGLAKGGASLGPSSDVSLSASPTMTYAATAAGMILGTAAYMSPEQARGKPVDRRTDIWSFGCVMYECLTAKPIFSGETVSDLVAQILQSEPDWSALPATTPASLSRLLERCLRKDPRERLRDIGDARIELSEIRGSAPDAAARARRRMSWMPTVLAGVAIGAALAALAWFAVQRSTRPPVAHEASVMLSAGQRISQNGSNAFVAMSRDGRAVAYVARSAAGSQIHVRRLDRREDLAIAGTQDARNIFFSPDGEWVAFFDTRNLMKVSVHGGAPVPIALATQDRGGVWLDDGSIVYTPDATRSLYRVPSGGGPAVEVTQLDSVKQERTHRWPDALDGGPWVVFTVGVLNSPGDYDGADIGAVSVKTGERRMLIRGARRALWAGPDHLVFDRKGTLFAVQLDPRDPRVTTEPVPVLEGVDGEGSSGASFVGIARDGTVAWVPSNEINTKRQIGWFDRAGRWTPTPVPPGEYRSAMVSPDGARALLIVGSGGGSGDVWLADLADGALRRLTYSNTVNSVAWFPDGSAIAHSVVDSTGIVHLATQRINGEGGMRFVQLLPPSGVVTSITADGSEALYSEWGSPSGRMHIASLGPLAASMQLPSDANQQSYELAGTLSPEGQWLAYVSNRTGRDEVFLRRRNQASGLWQVSTRGGTGVRWGRAGAELFFIEEEMLKSVKVTVKGDELVLGQPITLFEVPSCPSEPAFRDYSYDPRTDRFLFTRPPAGTDERREIALSIGWGARIAALIRARKEKR
ncbi:MAG: protein kinase [Candidatus Eisenbacteria bacterium]